jgi:hypothetical protein
LLGHQPRMFPASPPLLRIVQPSCWHSRLPI